MAASAQAAFPQAALKSIRLTDRPDRPVEVRLRQEFPEVGKRTFPCPQGDLNLVCEEEVISSPNPRLRRIEVSVYEIEAPERRIIKLVQLVMRER